MFCYDLDRNPIRFGPNKAALAKLRVDPTCGQQLFMVAAFNDSPALQHEDLIGMAHG